MERRFTWLALSFSLAASGAFACTGDDFEGSDPTIDDGGSSNSGGNTGAGSSTGASMGGGEPLNCDDPPIFETDIVPLFETTCGASNDMCHSRIAFGANDEFGCRGWLSLEDVALGSIYYAGPDQGNTTGCADMDLLTRLSMDAWQCDAPGSPGEGFVPYIVRCDPEASYMIRKMTGGAVGGPICDNPNGEPFGPMPLDLQPIQAQIDLVYNWIAAGLPTLANPECSCGNGGTGGSSGTSQNPSPNISHPGDMQTRDANVPFPFTGSATDPQDGDIPGNALLWFSDIDGPLNGGQPSANFTQGLSEGTHTITLEATDSDDNTGTTSITLFMVP